MWIMTMIFEMGRPEVTREGEMCCLRMRLKPNRAFQLRHCVWPISTDLVAPLTNATWKRTFTFASCI